MTDKTLKHQIIMAAMTHALNQTLDSLTRTAQQAGMPIDEFAMCLVSSLAGLTGQAAGLGNISLEEVNKVIEANFVHAQVRFKRAATEPVKAEKPAQQEDSKPTTLLN